MPSEKSLSIKTTTIEIKVIRVDGHKMTKATFRQIQTDLDWIISGAELLGWVDDDGIWVLFQIGNQIKRRRVQGYDKSSYALDGSSFREYWFTYTETFKHLSYDERIKNMNWDIKKHLKRVQSICDQLFIAT